MRALLLAIVLLTACTTEQAGPVDVTCHGIPDEICTSTDWLEMTTYAASRVDEIIVRCDGVCDASGSADVELVLDNGHRTSVTYTWTGAEPSG